MATVQVSPLIYSRFRGIREHNGVNSGGEISAIKCENVELFQSDIGNEVGIKSIEGNTLYSAMATGYNIIGMFKSEQKLSDSSDTFKTYFLIYAENNEQGNLYYLDDNNQRQSLLTGLTRTGKCNGITMTSTAYDVFVFTNGVEAYSISFAESPYPKKTKITDGVTPATDRKGNPINFLAMANFNGFLVVATKYGVRASCQNDIYTWNKQTTGAADNWDIDYSKPVTALYAYTGGLFIFTGDTTDFITGTPNITSNRLLNTAGVGCYDYQSIVKHDTFLFFYDNNQKNIYYIQNIDNGQTRPSGPIAKEIQSYFRNVETFKMYSCIYNSRNEIWCIINNKVMVYDYFQQEWTERHYPKQINTVLMIKNAIYVSTTDRVTIENNTTLYSAIYQVNTGDTFGGEIINSIYETCFINVGSNSNLKKQKTPLLIVLNDTFTNDFFIQLIVNGKEKSPKRIILKSKAKGFFYKEPEEGEEAPDSMYFYDADTGKGAFFSDQNPYSKTVKEVSTPQTWYTLGIRIYTKELKQGFCINSIELKNIKAKLKTKGR